MNRATRPLFWNSPGSWTTLNGSAPGTQGMVIIRYTKSNALSTATMAKVMRQPTAKPMARPSGRPMMPAMAVPVSTRLNAKERLSEVTKRTAMEAAMAQNTEWAQATTKRDAISIQ